MIGIDTRTEVLKSALIVENFTSLFLAALLGIKNLKESRVLGNKSNPISFNQKVTLLIEIEAIDSSQKNKFLTFMEVRNQFMHNFEAHNYETCFSYLDGKDKFLLKTYPQDFDIPRENQLKLAFSSLSEEVINLTMELYDKVKDKIRFEVMSDSDRKFKENALATIKEIKNSFDSVYDKAAKNNSKTINIDELKGLGTLISRIFFKGIISKMHTSK